LRRFADISSNNSQFAALAYRDAGHALIAIKASGNPTGYNQTYTNPRHSQWAAAAHAYRLRVAHYHFAGSGPLDAAEQAQLLVRTINPSWYPGDVAVLDFEDEAIPPSSRLAFIRQFLAGLGNRPAWLYSGKWMLQEAGIHAAHLPGVPLWLASYAPSWGDHLLPAGWTKDRLVAWQFTDRATVPGVGPAGAIADYSEHYVTAESPTTPPEDIVTPQDIQDIAAAVKAALDVDYRKGAGEKSFSPMPTHGEGLAVTQANTGALLAQLGPIKSDVDFGDTVIGQIKAQVTDLAADVAIIKAVLMSSPSAAGGQS
jgi:hypothetical protein